MEVKNERWKPLSEVSIPPVENKGFMCDVIIRNVGKPCVQTIKKLKGCLIREKTGEKKYISDGSITVGKSINADYQIDGNNAISRKHARVLAKNGSFYIEDLGSRNHTYVSGELINEIKELFNGVSIRLANEEFVFAIEEEVVERQRILR